MKLSQEEASNLIIKACRDVVDSKNNLRFGQALWNLLPKNVADVHHSSVNDFFYWKDEGKVLYTFFKHCVE